MGVAFPVASRVPVVGLLAVLITGGFAGAQSAGSGIEPVEDGGVGARLQEAWGVEPLDVPMDDEGLRHWVGVAGDRFDGGWDPAAWSVLDGVDPQVTGAVARLLAVLMFVQEVRDEEFAHVDDAVLHEWLHVERADVEDLGFLSGVDEHRLRRATVTLAHAVDEALGVLEPHVEGPTSPLGGGLVPPLVDLAPVLVMDPVGVDNLYEKDAVLMVDLGGDDVYDANAGGAMIHRGLVGDPESCQHHVSGYSIGCENEDSFESYTASLLIEVAGSDTYGVYKSPRPGSRDAWCGPEPIIRRVVTYGSGSGGIGMLVDVRGDDEYHGKTLSMGNGHLAGVGAFFDLVGEDRYQAVRSAMGSSILQGSGFFFDGVGDDSYRFQVPAGGLFNVDRGFCDRSERLGLGSAVIQGHAAFIDGAGADTYRVDSQSLGHVEAMGAAQFLDLGGVDDYGGYPGRGNGQVELGEGTFIDRE